MNKYAMCSSSAWAYETVEALRKQRNVIRVPPPGSDHPADIWRHDAVRKGLAKQHSAQVLVPCLVSDTQIHSRFGGLGFRNSSPCADGHAGRENFPDKRSMMNPSRAQCYEIDPRISHFHEVQSTACICTIADLPHQEDGPRITTCLKICLDHFKEHVLDHVVDASVAI